jgi:alkylated DNA repair protein (DNA oxidative demethylase)
MQAERERLGPQSWLLRGYALPRVPELVDALEDVLRRAPLRHMVTPGGLAMSVALTNCGELGWTSDRRGYRYTEADPGTGHPWPRMPAAFSGLARDAAGQAGFDAFAPDACLVNRYVPGARLSLHQDRDERDFDAPIVSVSLGLPAVFLFGGGKRSERPARIALSHGDVVVWGGVDRLRYHGVAPLAAASGDLSGDLFPADLPALLADRRMNLTFRKAG